MTDEQQAAYIYAQSICMLAEIEAMKAANASRAFCGFTPAYGEEAFAALPDQYGLSHNAVISFFQQYK